MKKPKLCERCQQRPAEVPDRDRPGRPIKRLCRDCHAGNLCEDIKQVAIAEVRSCGWKSL